MHHNYTSTWDVIISNYPQEKDRSALSYYLEVNMSTKTYLWGSVIALISSKKTYLKYLKGYIWYVFTLMKY